MLSRRTLVVKKRRSPMAAKKTKSSKKMVTITIDAEALQKLREAVDALSEFGEGVETAVDDESQRRQILKSRAKKRR
jgi:hypothetical protein